MTLKSSKQFLRILILGLCVVSTPAKLPAVEADRKVEFNRDIRPLLSDTCFRCHGPDEQARKSGLRLDLKKTALTMLRAASPNWRPPVLAVSALAKRGIPELSRLTCFPD